MFISPELTYGLGAVVLLGALIWGVMQYSMRNKANDAVTERATREEYKHPETYGERREAFKQEIKPS